jgi:hypothetical protein
MGLLTTFTLDLNVELPLLGMNLPLEDKLELRIRELRLAPDGDITGEGLFVHLPTRWEIRKRDSSHGRRRRHRVPVDQVETVCSFRCYIDQDGRWIVEVTLQD